MPGYMPSAPAEAQLLHNELSFKSIFAIKNKEKALELLEKLGIKHTDGLALRQLKLLEYREEFFRRSTAELAEPQGHLPQFAARSARQVDMYRPDICYNLKRNVAVLAPFRQSIAPAIFLMLDRRTP